MSKIAATRKPTQYQPSVHVTYADIDRSLHNMQPGQWFILPSGARGQYLGVTHAGPVVNWVAGKFDKKHAKANHPLRQYAKIYK